MKFLWIVLVLSGISLFYIPNTASIFSGGHSYYNIDPIGNQIPCQKCHADIQNEMHNSFKHKDLKCEDCHRAQKGVQYASGDDAYERMLYVNVTGPAIIKYRVLVTTIQNYQQGNFPKSISGEISIDQWALDGNDAIELRNANDKYLGNMTPGDTGIFYNYADVSKIPLYYEDGTPKDTDNTTKYSGLDTRKIKVNSDPYGADVLTGAGSREVTPGTLAHASTTILCAECHQEYLNNNPDTVHESLINYSIENNVNDACIACHTSTAVSINWKRPSAMGINTVSNGLEMKITDTTDIFPIQVETFGNQSGDIYAVSELALSGLIPAEGSNRVSSISAISAPIPAPTPLIPGAFSFAPGSIPQTTPTQKLIFDGTIKASDHRNGNLGSSMAGYGAYNGWYCIPQSDSFTTIPAPGGRTGYAVKVIARPGLSACGSTNKDQHLQLTKIITGMPTTHKEVWIGWSTMLDSSWQPQGAGAWEHFGIALTILSFKLPNTGLYTDIGTSDTSITITNNLRFNQPALSAVENTKGVWNDWMFHVKWAKDNTGFIELYHKTGTNQYTKTYSIYNVATLNPSNPNNDFDVRLGLYRSELSKSTQIFYSQGIKVGTNRAEVEYKG
jgi:hypothetical protein